MVMGDRASASRPAKLPNSAARIVGAHRTPPLRLSEGFSRQAYVSNSHTISPKRIKSAMTIAVTAFLIDS